MEKDDVLKPLERHLSEFSYNSRRPYYNDSSDYTTNAPSYYDDLARKNELIKHLALRIWDYDEELAKRFAEWDKQVEELPDVVKEMLDKWIDEGIIDHIINEKLFGDLQDAIRDMYIYHSDEKFLFVHAQNGDDTTGDGSEENPYKSPLKAFEYLRSLSDIKAEGQWTIRLSGTFTEGYRIDNLPKFRYPLKIVGDLSVTGQPDTIFDGQGASRSQGFWFEHAHGLHIRVLNIKFQNYGTDELVGQALILRDGGFLHVENCHFTDVYQAISTVNQSRNSVQHCIFTRCATGVTTQYGGTLTVGSTSDTEYRKNIFKDCRYAVRVTRNSVAHVDYNEILDSTITGVSIDINSRVNVTGNYFRGNAQGVTATGGAEWLNNNNTFESNDMDFQHYGVGRESRTHSVRSNVWFDQTPHVPSIEKYTLPVADRPETLFALPSVYNINKQQIADPGKRFKVRISGTIRNPNGAEGSVIVRTVDHDTGGNHDDIGFIDITETGMFLQHFDFEVELLVIEKNRQVTTNKLFLSNSSPKYSRGSWNKIFDTDKAFRIVGNADKEGIEVDVRFVQTSIGG